jgi:hypothetical protein
MASEVRVNKLQNIIGLSTVTLGISGIEISGNTNIVGVLSATSGTNLTGSVNISSAAVNSLAVSGITTVSSGSAAAPSISPSGDPNTGIYSPGADQLAVATNGVGRITVDSSGRLLVGTSTGFSLGDQAQYGKIQIVGNTFQAFGQGIIAIGRGEAAANITTDEKIGDVVFCDSQGGQFAQITAFADGTAGSSYPGRLVFSTTADGASSPTERMRITSAGHVVFGKTDPAGSVVGTTIYSGNVAWKGQIVCTVNNEVCGDFNRLATDGILVRFSQDNTAEGSISVSGTTVSYNGAHLSRWSQLPSGVERTEILRGTVLSNIDEMCEWGEEDNEQLNRMKVSDVEGDKNVSGVFQGWDDDDDTYTNDFYCAMTGDFIIRIAEGITVERGDLLMSAGDGTAKPQDDDIIRSKTIAKVTSTNVSCTYEDGSYCVPCVLMAC